MNTWFLYGLFVGFVSVVGISCALIAKSLTEKEKANQHRSTSHSAA